MKAKAPVSGYEGGTWLVICDRCGHRYRNYQLRKEWTGLMTCTGGGTNSCWEPRHPQDRVRGVKDQQAPPWVRPEPPEIDVSVGSGNEVSAEDL